MKQYKQRITAVFIFKNGLVVVTDQDGQQMPFFQGRRNFEVMKRIKDRIGRQKPCSVEWKIQEGADFNGKDGVVIYP